MLKEMKMTYIYPQNMRAAAKIWLWTMKDFAIIFIAVLLSAVFITQAGFFIPAAITLCYNSICGNLIAHKMIF